MKTFAGILAALLMVATGLIQAQTPGENCPKLPRSTVKPETEGGGFTRIKPCLRANPRHPTVIVRGDSIVFDGSASTGEITKYKWTLAPKDCPDGPDEWTTEKATFTATILCSMAVALEVTDGKETNRKDTTVTVKARAWKTEMRSRPAKKSMSFVSNSMEFGKNRCQNTNHVDEDAGDYIHFADGQPITWKGGAYWPAEVKGDGPFSGYWYLGRGKVQVVRNEFINSRLIDATGDIYRLNVANKNLNDLKLIIQQVRMHERIHSDLMMEALKTARDPAVQIEPLLDRNVGKLQEKADDVIRTVNTTIAEATTEEKVKAKLGEISQFDHKKACIFTEDGVEKCFPDVANMGDVPP